MKTRFFAILAIACLLCVVNTEAATGVEAPPARLPMMGSELAFNSWIVTNQIVLANVSVVYTNESGLLVGPGTGKWVKFPSEQSYQSYVSSNGFRTFSNNRSNFSSVKPLFLLVDIGYYLPDLDMGGAIWVLGAKKSLGLPETITSNSFVGVTPRQARAYVSVPGLRQFTVEVRGVYTNYWSVTAGRPTPDTNLVPPPPAELTTNGYVVLNQWYSVGTNQTEVRISISAGGKTNWYTQFGDLVNTPPKMTLRSSLLECTFARGAIAQIQASTDLKNWSVITNYSDMGGVGSYSLQINKNQPQQFFRVGIR